MAPRPLHYLLVEDDDAHARIVEMAFREYPSFKSIDRVADGSQALRYLRREPPYEASRRPDMVLLDLNLPGVSGHEVLVEVKNDPALRSIPVVILSTSDAESDRARAYDHHANSYLSKPMEFGEFVEMVRQLETYWSVWNRPAPVG